MAKKKEIKESKQKIVKPKKEKKKQEKKAKKVLSIPKFEEKRGLEKLYVYFTIVNKGLGDNIISILEEIGCSASVVLSGNGTASKEMQAILDIKDLSKEIVISFVNKSDLDDIEKEIAVFFASANKNKGVAFAIPMRAIEGIRLYKFLTRTL